MNFAYWKEEVDPVCDQQISEQQSDLRSSERLFNGILVVHMNPHQKYADDYESVPPFFESLY